MKNFDLKKIVKLKYLFVIRRERDFSVLSSFSISALRIVVLSGFIFLVIFGLALLSTKTIFKGWFDPAAVQMANTNKILVLTDQVDSLIAEVSKKDQYISNLQMIIIGEEINSDALERSSGVADDRPNPVLNQQWSPGAQKIIEEFQSIRSDAVSSNRTMIESNLRSILLFPPIKGIISAKFNPANNHFGIDIVAKENDPVSAIADGTIILSNWTLNTGYVIGIQHKDDMLSFYKHNSVLLKSVGDVVRNGDIISIVGNTGDFSSGAHLHFELWYKGSPLNPQEFITFD